MKKLLAVFLSLLMLVPLASLPAYAVGYDPSATYTVQAESAYIVNTDTNLIIYEKSSETPTKAAGLTKLMTAALILTQYQDALDTTTVTIPAAISDYVYKTNNADMRTGETYTLREILYAMLLRNANEAAMAAAYQLSGNDLTGWVSQMNSLSQKIGTTGSTWTDACGIDAGNVTTARDSYLLLRYLMGFDAFVQIEGTAVFQMPAKEKHSAASNLVNQNVMVNASSGGKYYRSSIKGGKTDIPNYVADSGTQSCVSWATQNGETYIFAVMNSPDTCDDYGYASRRPALCETTKLADWVFSSFSIQNALDSDQPLCEIPVKYSLETDTLMLYPNDDMMTILPSSSDASVTQKVYNLPDYVCAPIHQGDVVGTVTLMLAGEAIGTVDLVAGQDVSRNSFLFGVSKLQEFFTSLYFRVLLTLSLLCFAGYLAWFFFNAYVHRNSRKVRRRH